MPTTLTLKNVPDDIYERLKLAAQAHRRSINSEVIVCLETCALADGRHACRAARTRAASARGPWRCALLGNRDRPAEENGPSVIVVDTNVIAHLYLPCEHTQAAEALLESDPEWAAPVLWRSELRNVLAGYIRRGALTFEQAAAIQAEAEDLLPRSRIRPRLAQRAPTRSRFRLFSIRLRVRGAGDCAWARAWPPATLSCSRRSREVATAL